jgi:NAD(P)-dependent dehydrogenase (short-subunit alcohol dehydrogenase family)
MDLQISGKKALVLGASRGLGAAIAHGLAAEGVDVLAAALLQISILVIMAVGWDVDYLAASRFSRL